MAHKKGQGTSRNGRDSNAQRLGFKAFGGQIVPGGTIIVRQRGTRVKPGLNVGRGKDDTLFAKITGRIKFLNKGLDGQVRDGRARRSRVASRCRKVRGAGMPAPHSLAFGTRLLFFETRLSRDLRSRGDQSLITTRLTSCQRPTTND